MNSLSILLLSMTLSFLSYVLIARWYLMPALNRLSLAAALAPLLLFHSFRHIGMTFLLPGVVAHDLSPAFAVPAAYGDLAAAFLALLAVLALRLGWGLAIPLVWLFNLEGTIDLLIAPYQGFRLVEPAQFGSMYFIPTFIVPALLVTHVVIFILLMRPRQNEAVAVPT